jgi:hypothetical protein
MTAEPAGPLTWSHPAASVGARGVSIERAATHEELAHLKAALGILTADAFAARYTLKQEGKGSFRLAGTFEARLSQACVATLEPVTEQITETFTVEFRPPDRIAEAGDHERSVLDEPDVEVLTGDAIETGRVLFELLSAALDPYPRKGEAEFSWQDPKASPDAAAKLHPFAALSKLKTKD